MVSKDTRMNEWFVPNFGPEKFRAFVGLLFLPYTGMCISFAVIGSMLAPVIEWNRVSAIIIIYALALGIGAHAADGIGSKKIKPWGNYFTRRQMMYLLISSIAISYIIGIYYAIFYVPNLVIVGILEGFFLFAYNLEIWNGRFHNNFWFSFSWGALPFIAGYIMQTNSLAILPIFGAIVATFTSYLEIRFSRPYKQLKKINANSEEVKILERRLKIISLGTISFSIIFLTCRIFFR